MVNLLVAVITAFEYQILMMGIYQITCKPANGFCVFLRMKVKQLLLFILCQHVNKGHVTNSHFEDLTQLLCCRKGWFHTTFDDGIAHISNIQ